MALKLIVLAVILVLGIAAFVHLRAGAKERAAMDRYPAQGQFVTVNGLKVHALVRGSGPDLILIHGSSGNTRDMSFSLLDKLTDRYRVVVFDRPGLGWSDRLPRGAEGIFAQAAHLRAAAEQLGVNDPIVLGHSYGGAVALAWALDAPDSTRAVVNASGPSHPWDGGLSLFYTVNSSALGAALVVPMITAFVNPDTLDDEIAPIFAPQNMPDGYAEAIGTGLTLKREALRANAAHRASLKSEIIAMQPRYSDFPVPLEIVHGDADTTVGVEIHARKMLAETDQARLTVLPGIGHMPQHVSTDALVDAIDRAAARAPR